MIKMLYNTITSDIKLWNQFPELTPIYTIGAPSKILWAQENKQAKQPIQLNTNNHTTSTFEIFTNYADCLTHTPQNQNLTIPSILLTREDNTAFLTPQTEIECLTPYEQPFITTDTTTYWSKQYIINATEYAHQDWQSHHNYECLLFAAALIINLTIPNANITMSAAKNILNNHPFPLCIGQIAKTIHILSNCKKQLYTQSSINANPKEILQYLNNQYAITLPMPKNTTRPGKTPIELDTQHMITLLKKEQTIILIDNHGAEILNKSQLDNLMKSLITNWSYGFTYIGCKQGD